MKRTWNVPETLIQEFEDSDEPVLVHGKLILAGWCLILAVMFLDGVLLYMI